MNYVLRQGRKIEVDTLETGVSSRRRQKDLFVKVAVTGDGGDHQGYQDAQGHGGNIAAARGVESQGCVLHLVKRQANKVWDKS